MITKLYEILDDIAFRRYRQRLFGGLAAVWWLALGLGALMWANGAPKELLFRVVGSASVIASIAIFFWSKRVLGNPRAIARDIEARHPELQTALLAALDQKADRSAGGPSYLQARVIVETLATAERDEWQERVPHARLRTFRHLHLAGLFAILVFAVILLVPRHEKAEANAIPADPPATMAAETIKFQVDPGDVEIERGSPLTIQARFSDSIPQSATVETSFESGGGEELAMTRPFTDPVYQARIPSVAGPLNYRVVVPGGESPSYKVTVFDVPALRQADVVLHFPGHMGKVPEELKDVRNVQAVEQTRMDLTLLTNLPGLTASMVAKDESPLSLAPDPANPANYRLSMTLVKSARYQIVLTDAKGRRNSAKDVINVKVTTNKAPVVEVVLPRKNDKPNAIQEVRLEARVSDDTALLAHGLRYTLDGENWQEIPSAATTEKKPLLSHLVDLEAAEAKAKDIILWNAWAEDQGPDGKVRRVNGDIHVVRVRDFDEEYYQQSSPPGEPPPSSQGPGAELIKTQTEILNATWGIRRDHAEISKTPPNRKDLETLVESQKVNIELARETEGEQTDPALKQILMDARFSMEDAAKQLEAAVSNYTPVALDEAITHEQAALRNLYQLQSSKHMITQGAPGESSEEGGERVPQEMDIKPMETPYQAEKAAKPEAGSEAREAMEVLQRLAELAKRQRDLNDEIQALQMALNEAKTPEAQAEMERRLKQLREQQRDLLADMDKLDEKASETEADKPNNQTLDEAREKARQANEELDKGKMGEALAAGRRSQDSLEKLHEEFRETSAAKLAQQLRELRREARALDERQQELSRQAADSPEPRQQRLSEQTAGSDQAGIKQQRESLNKLMEGVRQTAEDAEKAEPLVAKDLSETLREANQSGVSKALEQMEKPSPGTSPDEAARSAAEGIAKLTKGIEETSERILGNEAQALRYAAEELEKLTNHLSGAAQPSQDQPEDPNAATDGQGEGKKPGSEQAGISEGENPQAGDQAGAGKPIGEQGDKGQQPGDEGQQANGQQPGGAGTPNNPRAGPGAPSDGRELGGGGREVAGGGQAGSDRGGFSETPITGEEFQEWSDRLADLEAVLDLPEAQSAVARARRASRELRKDFKRHSEVPEWELVETQVLQPLREASEELNERLRALNKENPLAPVGRDPVPDRYSEIVRRYFEELGK